MMSLRCTLSTRNNFTPAEIVFGYNMLTNEKCNKNEISKIIEKSKKSYIARMKKNYDNKVQKSHHSNNYVPVEPKLNKKRYLLEKKVFLIAFVIMY
ncbi:hypothetical protein A3Q56_04066 [Intoshia linei]|uniref:Uncharacterized protein n=1 Tax=Intoshia linei TaxID=1819745 RepID=A0A177B1Q0_9BILA|nr:hypothetical protein A3Q56_04066 [Intoshia linei]